MTTCLGMYGFLMTLCMRMWRVFRVYTLYTKYLADSKEALIKRYSTEPNSPARSHISEVEARDRNMESHSSLDSSSSDVYMQVDPSEMKEIAKLSEMRIIAVSLLGFMLPVLIFGSLAIYFPYVYAFMPVYESEICVCSFFGEIEF